jgi:hypothetical protein
MQLARLAEHKADSAEVQPRFRMGILDFIMAHLFPKFRFAISSISIANLSILNSDEA